MPDHVYKMVELVGSSPTSSDDAIRNAITIAAKTLRHIDWFQVLETRGHVADGKVAHFQVTLKVGFRLDATTDCDRSLRAKPNAESRLRRSRA